MKPKIETQIVFQTIEADDLSVPEDTETHTATVEDDTTPPTEAHEREAGFSSLDFLMARQAAGDKIEAEQRMAPVIEAQERMKPSVDKLLAIRAEVVKLRAEWLPKLEQLSKLRLDEIHQREKSRRIKDAAWHAMYKLREAFDQIDNALILQYDTFIRDHYTNLKPADCVGRNPARFFERMMAAQFGETNSAETTRKGFMQTIDYLYENLQMLKEWLEPPTKPVPTVNVNDLRPEMPKTEDEARKLNDHSQTHAQM